MCSFRIAKKDWPRTAKRDLIARKHKNPGLVRNPHASEIFLKAIDEFRRRKRLHSFIRVKPFATYFKSSKKRKDDFFSFAKELEEYRCKVLGMNENRFYKLAAEFVLCPNRTHYYNPLHLFGCDGSYEADEFRNRIFTVTTFLSTVVSTGNNEVEILELIEKIDSLGNRLDVKGVGFKSKDWYCMEAILRYQKSRNWTMEDFLQKLKLYYRARVKKVYPEMIMVDIVRGELDTLQFNNKKKTKRPSIIDTIHSQDWYSEWEKGLSERETLREGSEK